MFKNSDTNKIPKIKTNAEKIKNSITNQSVQNTNIINKIDTRYVHFDVLCKNVIFNTSWEAMNTIENVSYQFQYKFWEITIGEIDLTMLPFLRSEFLIQTNVVDIVTESYKTFAIDGSSAVLHAGLYFSDHSELIEYDPVQVKLLMAFDKIPLARLQSENKGGNFRNIYTEAVGG